MSSTRRLVRPARAVVRLVPLLVIPVACSSPRPPQVVEGQIEVPGGAHLSYRVIGSGPDTLLFVHGGPAVGSQYLESSFRELATEHTVVFYDMRGRGRSSPVVPEALSLAQDVQDLDAVRAHLRLGAMRLVGHQWGAGVAFEYAREHPASVHRMVLLAPMLLRSEYTYSLVKAFPDVRDTAYLTAISAREDSTDPVGYCYRFWPWQFGPWQIVDSAIVRALAPSVCEAPPEVIRARADIIAALRTRPGIWSWEEVLDSVPTPRLVILGNGEPAFVRAAERWATRGPAALLELGRSPHFPWVEAPRQVSAALEDFLVRERWPRGSRLAGEVTVPVTRP